MWSLGDSAGRGAFQYWNVVRDDLEAFDRSLQTAIKVTDRNMVGGNQNSAVAPSVREGERYPNPIFNELLKHGEEVPSAYTAAFYRSSVVELYSLFEELVEQIVRTFFQQLNPEAVASNPSLKQALVKGALNHAPGNSGKLWSNRVSETEFVTAFSDIIQDKAPKVADWLLLDRNSNMNGGWFKDLLSSLGPDVRSDNSRWSGIVDKNNFSLSVNTKGGENGLPIQNLTEFRNRFAHSGRLDSIDWIDLVKHFDHVCVSMIALCLHLSNIENVYNIPKYFEIGAHEEGAMNSGMSTGAADDAQTLVKFFMNDEPILRGCLKLNAVDEDETGYDLGRLSEDQVVRVLKTCFSPDYRWVLTPYTADVHRPLCEYSRLQNVQSVLLTRKSPDDPIE